MLCALVILDGFPSSPASALVLTPLCPVLPPPHRCSKSKMPVVLQGSAHAPFPQSKLGTPSPGSPASWFTFPGLTFYTRDSWPLATLVGVRMLALMPAPVFQCRSPSTN